MTMQWGPDNPFWDAFETDDTGRRANFLGRVESMGRQSPNRRQFFQKQFANVQDRYLARLGQMIQGGQSPTLSFSEHLTDYFKPEQGEGEQDWMDYQIGRGGNSTVGIVAPTRWNFSGGPSF